MEITEEDKRNNPGVDEHTIQAVKEQYHFHKLASVSFIPPHTLHCTFQVDTDPASIFYTPLEDGTAPVREYDVSKIEGVVSSKVEKEKIEIMPDGLAVRVGDHLIPTVLIFASS
jgi:hypothetical protein